MAQIQNTLTPWSGNWTKAKLNSLTPVVFVVLAVSLAAPFVQRWYGIDWIVYFKPAILLIVSGGSPFSIEGYFTPPWIILLLFPFAFLPDNTAVLLLTITGVLAFYHSARHFEASTLIAVLFLLTPQVIKSVSNGNIDWMVALGAALPPHIGLFLVLAKPQLGFGIAVYWFINGWRENGLYLTAKTFLPVSLIFALSLVIYGPWPLLSSSAAGYEWNTAAFPFLIPFGLAILAKSLQDQRKGLAVLAGPFFAPYMAVFSWCVPTIGLLSDKRIAIAVIVGMWLVQFVHGYMLF